MKITVKVKPNSKRTSVEKEESGQYMVRVNVPPKEGLANRAVIEALSEYFSIPKSRIEILHGQKGKMKVVEIV